MTRPTAAPAVWPYPHRTVAQVEADARKLPAPAHKERSA